MNDFLQQFLIESRELAEAASAGLMALEQSPGDSGRLDDVFRAFHTLKGGAGIVGFVALEHAAHGIEDLLTDARSGKRPLTAAGIGRCLACLDQIVDWLDVIEQTGEIPEVTGSHADGAVGGFNTAAAVPTSDSTSPDALASGWPAGILKIHHGLAARARTAVRFVPAHDCLYEGEDPLERMLTLPFLLALDLAPNKPWGPLDALDPFSCNLVFTALSGSPPADLRAHFEGHGGDCEVVAIAAGMQASETSLPPHVLAVIEAQQALLAEGSPQGFAGRIASAGLVAANALRFCDRTELCQGIESATERSLAQRTAQPLRHALSQLLPAAAPAAPALPAQPEVTARTLRIDAEQVDALVRLAGELTVVKNAIGHAVKLARPGDASLADVLKDRHGALEHLVGELQRCVLRMRVRPLRAVLQRFPRLVREMAANLGKSVKVVIEGGETEADKAIVEMLFEPLLHIVRNAIDHGVEREQERNAAGKLPIASLRIRARRRGDQVLVEISDDGAGIDPARVREVAATRGLITEEQRLTMTDAEALELIFAPGFSTSAQVTQVSGRGVGMDAVRKAVERIGGDVSVASVPGRGTDVKLSLPFSVMMAHVMTVEAGGQMFGLPLEAIIETVRISQAAISSVGTARAVVLRDRTLPLIDLAAVLGAETRPTDSDGATVVVAAANGEWGAFRVDRIVERLDLILKPLEGLLAGTPGIMGTTLLGDGRVLLVLDIAEMLR
ncbi:MAG TPA: chemotaxis protein CheA [Steroidobacteraceae bacterium]|nr:chemotaxis protein CheA [Steroidobacteraceae bacterium]